MTTPGINRPKPTSDKYNDVYSRGSTYGSDLNEQKVRGLLQTQTGSPLLSGITNFFGGIVGGIAQAITGKGGAGFEVVSGAVDERLGPMETEISKSGERMSQLSKEVEERLHDQVKILDDQEQAIKDAKDAVAQVREQLTASEEKQAQAVDDALKRADSAVEEAKKLLDGFDPGDLDVDVSEDPAFKAALDKIEESSLDARRALGRIDKTNELLEFVDLTDDEIKAGITKQYRPVFLRDVPDTYLKHVPRSEVPEGLPEGLEPFEVTGLPTLDGETFTSDPKYTQRLYLEPGRLYEFSLWVHVSTDTGQLMYYLLDPKTGTIFSSEYPVSMVVPVPTYVVDPKTGEEYYEDIYRYNKTSYIQAIQNTSPGWVKLTARVRAEMSEMLLPPPMLTYELGRYVAGFSVSEVVPSQESIDKAQNKAIENLELVAQAHSTSMYLLEETNRIEQEMRDEQHANQQKFNEISKKTDEAQNKAIAANSDAIRALARGDDGINLLPYADLTDEDIAAGITERYKPSNAPKDAEYVRQVVANAHRVGFRCPEPKIVFESGSIHEFIADSNKTYRIRLWANHPPKTCKFWYYNKTNLYGTKDIKFESDPVVSEGPYSLYEAFYTFGPVNRVLFKELVFDLAKPMVFDLEVSPVVPSQKDIDAAQDKAIEAVAKASEANTKAIEMGKQFDEQQIQVNDAVQEQLWLHQDMLELVDIRSPKTYGWVFSKSDPTALCPYADIRKSYPVHEAPFFTAWRFNNGIMVACKGQWIGKVNVAHNWSGGQIDEYVLDVTKSRRIFWMSGGAFHISPRSARITISIENLARQVFASRGKANVTPSLPDINNLVRDTAPGRVRFKNTVRCNQSVYCFRSDGKRVYYPKDRLISGVWVDMTSIPTSGYTYFTEDTLYSAEYTKTAFGLPSGTTPDQRL